MLKLKYLLFLDFFHVLLYLKNGSSLTLSNFKGDIYNDKGKEN